MPVTNVRSRYSSGDLVFEKLDGTELMTVGVAGVNIPTFTIDGLVLDVGATVDLNGVADALVLDADGDTSISAPTDNQIDIEIAGADDFTFTANSFNVLTGSAIGLADSCALKIGTGVDDSIAHNGTDTLWTHTTGDLTIDNTLVTGSTIMLLGTDTTATDFQVQNNSALGLLVVTPVTAGGGTTTACGLQAKQTTSVPITQATTLTLADSGGIFTVDQGAAYDIDLPSPTSGPGCSYTFSLTNAAANSVTITVAGSAATFVGTIVNDVTSVVPATGNTLTFASGQAALGDTIIIRSISTSLYHVQAITSTATGIAVS